MNNTSQSKARKTIICNPSYGNNPYIRTTEMALAWSDKLGGNISVVVPHVYGEKQARILREHFGEDQRLILDETFGAMLRKVFFDGTSYSAFLRQWMEQVDDVSKEAQEYLHSTYDIQCEIARAPLLDLGITPAFYNSWSRVSRIARRAIREPLINLDRTLLEQAAARMEALETRYALHMISVPGTFEPAMTDIPIPLRLATPEPSDDTVNRGIYVTVSGIPKVSSLLCIVDHLRMKTYTNDSSRIHGAVHASPGILWKPEIIAHIARAGWGSAGMSLASGTPLILPPYENDEDPEIFFNIRRIEELGLGIAFTGQTPNELLNAIEELRPRIVAYRQELLQRFGTMNGAQVATEKIGKYMFDRHSELRIPNS